MPLSDRLPGLGEHFVPVLDLHRSALAAEDDLSDEFVSSHPVVVHDGNAETRLSDDVIGNAEHERLVEDRTETFLQRRCLPLLHFLSLSKKPDLDVGI